jgi:hypothetical protein
MRIAQFIAATALTFASFACAATHRLPPGQLVGEAIQPQETHRFAVVDAEPAKFFNQTLLVEATVQAVCLKKGCWMKVADEGKVAMVRWESGCGGQYAFPVDAVGKRVLIQGSFYPKTISEADAEHLQEEAGGKVEIPSEGYEFNASSVLILEPTK